MWKDVVAGGHVVVPPTFAVHRHVDADAATAVVGEEDVLA